MMDFVAQHTVRRIVESDTQFRRAVGVAKGMQFLYGHDSAFGSRLDQIAADPEDLAKFRGLVGWIVGNHFASPNTASIDLAPILQASRSEDVVPIGESVVQLSVYEVGTWLPTATDLVDWLREIAHVFSDPDYF